MRNEPTHTRPIAASPAEAARLIGIGRTKLYEALSSGVLPSYRVGTRRLIRVADLEAWLEAQPANAGRQAVRAKPG
ncbi:MAG: helix-turn-helix domain-containing protein [Terricaulis sp.]